MRFLLAANLRFTRILIISFRVRRLGKGFFRHVSLFAVGGTNLYVAFLAADDFHQLPAFKFQSYVESIQRFVHPDAIFVRSALYRAGFRCMSWERANHGEKDENGYRDTSHSVPRASGAARFIYRSRGIAISGLFLAVRELGDCFHPAAR